MLDILFLALNYPLDGVEAFHQGGPLRAISFSSIFRVVLKVLRDGSEGLSSLIRLADHLVSCKMKGRGAFPMEGQRDRAELT